jgi:hypothetical protein
LTLAHDFDELREERVKADAKIEEFARRIKRGSLRQALAFK